MFLIGSKTQRLFRVEQSPWWVCLVLLLGDIRCLYTASVVPARKFCGRVTGRVGGLGRDVPTGRSNRRGPCPGRTPRERRRTAVRAAVVVMKRGNSRGAKGGRKRNHGGKQSPYGQRQRLPSGLEQRGHKSLGEAKSEPRCAGSNKARAAVLCRPDCLCSGIRRKSRKGRAGKTVTGEPCAGDPHARFGGRGEASQCLVPTSIVEI